MKKLVLLSFALFAFISLAKAQVSAGVNLQSSETFVTIGTDPSKQIFGEARIGTGGDVGVELMGAYNIIRKEDVNFYAGLGLGLDDDRNHNHDDEDDIYIAIPIGLLVTPFNSKNLGLVLEAAPILADDHGDYFRAGFGFKYTFR
ncbi:outer membrane insertion C- signal [Algoriphagus halophytocola]|uniref:Outer membrane insertion C- signal n=1 Tax=Algoriphagus halophytocola TaxID=2991499 RepID=A0ABY6MEB0_9BACT|nr:outer membrane insertion C- signal [Algoriphagus sp. TR-M5]UZD21250.1 outer membrane insertion C- signal [Algoriphagus sp. TR-M5]